MKCVDRYREEGLLAATYPFYAGLNLKVIECPFIVDPCLVIIPTLICKCIDFNSCSILICLVIETSIKDLCKLCQTYMY